MICRTCRHLIHRRMQVLEITVVARIVTSMHWRMEIII